MFRKNKLAERIEQNRYLPMVYAEAIGEAGDKENKNKSPIKIKLQQNIDYSGKLVYEVAVESQSLLKTIGSTKYFSEHTEKYIPFPTEHYALKRAAKEFANTCVYFGFKIDIKNICPQDVRDLIYYYTNYTFAA
jgi:hypothetical protein